MYAKVFAQIFDGTLCTVGPWESLVTFQQLLILADQDGHVDMTATAISRRTTIPLEIIEKGIAALLLPDLESRTPTEEGRRIVPLSEGRAWGWRVVNYKHYRQLKREEDRRSYHREYWHSRKEKTQQTQQTQPNQPIAEAEAEAEAKKSSKDDLAKKSKITKPIDVSDEIWEDWKKHRKAKRATITLAVIQSFREQASKVNWTLEAAMQKSIERGWTGFEAEWITKSSGSGYTKKFDPLAFINEGKKNESDRSEKTIDGEVLDRATSERPVSNGFAVQTV